jgi:hypothetical protein
MKDIATDRLIRSIITLHPYVGFTIRPGLTPIESLPADQLQAMSGLPREAWTTSAAPAWMHRQANSLGTWSERPFPDASAPGEFVVAVFGSSVASWLATQAADLLRARLREHAEFRNTSIVVLNFAIHGGKQPQQLAVLNYALSLGQRIDVAVNIDGINELLWAHYNHTVHAVDFSYPSIHLLSPLKQLTAGGEAGAAGLMALADSLRARERAERFAALGRRLKFAPLTSACSALERLMRTRATELLSRAAEARTDPATDPMPFPESPAGTTQRSFGTFWQHCSRQFHLICKAHGIAYLHVLQPTPYTAGRRASGKEQLFLEPEGASAQLLVEKYPELVQLAAQLRRDGIAVAEADHLFARVAETVFSDHWGHLNRRGNEVLAELVARECGALLGARRAVVSA